MSLLVAGSLNTMIYFLRSGVPGVRRAALRACTVMAEQAPVLTAYEFATKEGEARQRTEPAACSGNLQRHSSCSQRALCVVSAPAVSGKLLLATVV